MIIMEKGTYIRGEACWWDDFVGAVEERIEHISRVIDLLQIRDWLNRRTENESWKQY